MVTTWTALAPDRSPASELSAKPGSGRAVINTCVPSAKNPSAEAGESTKEPVPGSTVEVMRRKSAERFAVRVESVAGAVMVRGLGALGASDQS